MKKFIVLVMIIVTLFIMTGCAADKMFKERTNFIDENGEVYAYAIYDSDGNLLERWEKAS